MKDSIEHFEVDITEDGIKLEAHGFKGKGCIKESEKLEAAIGGNTDRKLKAAYHKVANTIKNTLGVN